MKLIKKYSKNSLLAVLTIAAVTIIFSSCGKTNVTPGKTDTTKTPTGTASTADVYMAGTVNNKATVWKNGVATTLSSSSAKTSATAVFVNGADVYVAGAGTDGNNANGVAIVWKNGIASVLPAGNSDAQAYSLYVSASGVYVAGYTTITYQNNQPYPNNGVASYRAATVWINGVPAVLSDGNKAFFDNNGLLGLNIALARDSQGNGVYANGSDVYVAGNEDQGAYGEINATLWKNQFKLILFNNIGGDYTSNQPQGGFVGKFFSGDTSYIIPPTFSLSSTNNASSVFVSNGIVYAAGFVTVGAQNGGIQVNAPHKATVWKNGVPKALGDSTMWGNPNALYVSGNDVYAAGFTLGTGNDAATLWKNGTATTLATSGTGAIATGVFVSGTDVYVAGNSFSGLTAQGVLWKNGVASYFTDPTNTTTIKSVYVKSN